MVVVRLADASAALGVDSSGFGDDGVVPMVRVRRNVGGLFECGSEGFEDGADSDAVMGGEVVPLIVGCAADVGVYGTTLLGGHEVFFRVRRFSGASSSFPT